MFESILDFQFEVLTSYFNDGEELPERSHVNSAHAYIAAPYGIYETKDDYIAIAMADVIELSTLLQCDQLNQFTQKENWFLQRDGIKSILADHLKTETAHHWLNILESADVWCAPVLNYNQLIQHQGYRVLNMEINVTTRSGQTVKTTRCPIQVDGQQLVSSTGAPQLGEHNFLIEKQFDINVGLTQR
jgi:crotonobetainyl-CoA:carnitine CoA-transferase CaiB-like acyl-CoA transferase